MAETDPQPMTDADAAPPPANTALVPAEPLKDAGAAFEPAAGGAPAAEGAGAAHSGEGLAKQAGDKALGFVGQGKDRATEALDQLTKVLTDAADQVDEKVGAQYGQYARTAAGNVQQLAEQIRAKDADELVDDARAFIRKSPGVAIGAAAAVGFVLARLVSAGVDQRNA